MHLFRAVIVAIGLAWSAVAFGQTPAICVTCPVIPWGSGSGSGGGGGGTIGGTIASGQVAFGTAADEIGGDAGLTYNAGTNVLSAGDVTFTNTQTANSFLAGPTSGAAAAPTWRAIVDADVPDTITINGTNNVTWASVNKTGSSLADLATRVISNLQSSASSELLGVLSDETGTGLAVFATSPTFTTDLGFATSRLNGETANVIEQRNGTNTQAFRLYKTFTDASNYERVSLYQTGNEFFLEQQSLGTGAARSLYLRSTNTVVLESIAGQVIFRSGGVDRWYVDQNSNDGVRGSQYPVTTLGPDLGLSSNRIRKLWVGTQIGGLGGTTSINLLATVPTITSGFGTTPAIAGIASSFRVIVGTGGIAATGVVAFNGTFGAAPSCQPNNDTTILLVQATSTTTTVTLTSATPWGAGDVIRVSCIGY